MLFVIVIKHHNRNRRRRRRRRHIIGVCIFVTSIVCFDWSRGVWWSGHTEAAAAAKKVYFIFGPLHTRYCGWTSYYCESSVPIGATDDLNKRSAHYTCPSSLVCHCVALCVYSTCAHRVTFHYFLLTTKQNQKNNNENSKHKMTQSPRARARVERNKQLFPLRSEARSVGSCPVLLLLGPNPLIPLIPSLSRRQRFTVA